jgi:hypothetical protein
VASGTGDAGTCTANGAVGEAVTFGGAGSVPRGGAGGGGLWTLAVAAGVDVDPIALRGRCGRTGECFRLGSGEACGSFCPEPETVSACVVSSTTDE